MQEFSHSDIQAFSNLLISSEKIVIVTHTHPDGDALGSGTGMQRFLASLGRQSTLLIPDPVNETLAFLRKEGDQPLVVASENPEGARELLKEADLIICQDLNHAKRAEKIIEAAFNESPAKKILIDHHLGPDMESFGIIFSETAVSSASELVFWLLLELPQTGGDIHRIPSEALEALMVGMTTDTNNFANSTSPDTLRMASMCIAAGVDRDAILAEIYQHYREERFAFMGYYLSSKLHITEKGVAYGVFSAKELCDFDIQDGDTEGFVNMPLGIERVRMSFFLKEQDGAYRVSIRSKKGTSANLCSRMYFNGGGHENAAGGRLPAADFADLAAVEAYIVKSTDEFLK